MHEKIIIFSVFFASDVDKFSCLISFCCHFLFAPDYQASDVLAVELLQKDARLAASGELGRACPGGT